MVYVGICRKCDTKVTAHHATAGAAEMHCEHTFMDVLWFSLKNTEPPPAASNQPPTKEK